MSAKLYAIPADAPVNDRYEIFINGQHAAAHEARVSIMPFNRHWPGHQRPLDQTEVIPFINFEMTGPVELMIHAPEDFKMVVLRPASKGIKPQCENRKITFTISKPGQYSLEIDGTRKALQIFANPPAQYHVSETDANTLYFGPGVHHAGIIDLKSGQTVYIHESAVVYAQIHATDAENIRILGRGILDHSWVDAKETCKNTSKNVRDVDPVRPSPIVLCYCRNVLIEGITVRDPAFLGVRPIACENVEIDNMKIIGCWRYNSDGIDFINSHHCYVRNCYVRSFDDSLSLKGFYFLHQGEMFHNGACHAVMNDVVFENCVVWNEWGSCLNIGLDVCAMEIKNCVFRNCDIIHCHGSSCMNAKNVDYAHIHDISFEDIRVEYDPVIQEPTIQTDDEDTFLWNPASLYMPSLFSLAVDFTFYSYGGTVRGKIDHITFKNIHVSAPRVPPSIFYGYEEGHGVDHVCISDVTVNGEPIKTLDALRLTTKDFVSNVVLE